MFRPPVLHRLRLSSIAAAGLLLATPASGAIVSTFETGSEGWRAVGGATLSRPASGGNPGGYLRFLDASSGGYRGVAPEKFRGDLTPYIGGELRFDYRVIQNRGPGEGTGTVFIGSSDDFAVYDLIREAPPPFDWTTYKAPLDAQLWGKTEAEWALLMANVTAIQIAMEAGGTNDASGLDNFSIVPLPGALLLAVTSFTTLVGLARFGAQRRHRGWDVHATPPSAAR